MDVTGHGETFAVPDKLIDAAFPLDGGDGFANGLVDVQLTPDRMHLAIRLDPSALDRPRAEIIALVQRHCRALALCIPYDVTMVEVYLRVCSPGAWVTVVSGKASTPPKDGYVEMFLPLSMAMDDDLGVRRRHAVRGGEVLARLHAGIPGSFGQDLCGHVVEAPRRPSEARLPQGEGTEISADGTTLLAARDGEVVLRDMLAHVQPVCLIDGDSLMVGTPLVHDGDVFVKGSIGPGRELQARGHVHVEGHIIEAAVTSTQGNVSIYGSITGGSGRPARICAAGDITCGTALYATLRAKGNIHLLRRARHSTITALRDVYLRDTIVASLFNVEVEVQGGLIPTVPASPSGPVPAERRHVRVPTNLRAEVALHGIQPLAFEQYVIEDLSACGARLRCDTAQAAVAESGTLLQVKFLLPHCAGHVLALGRVARLVDRATIAVDFLDMPEGHEDRLSAFCHRVLEEQPGAASTSSADRKLDA